jgi:AcrR family transcriptional regulator
VSDSVRERALDGARRTVAHLGVSATTLEAVAHESSLSRATLYRHFPEGRRQLFDELVDLEITSFFVALWGEVQSLRTIELFLSTRSACGAPGHREPPPAPRRSCAKIPRCSSLA